MANNNAKVIMKNRSSVGRQMVEHSLSFFKLQTRQPVDRRRINDRRLFLKQGYLDHKPERRSNMICRRMMGERRGLLSQYYEYFLEKSTLIFKRTPLAR